MMVEMYTVETTLHLDIDADWRTQWNDHTFLCSV